MADMTPEQIRDRMLDKLAERRKVIQTYDDYYRGKHPLAYSSRKFLDAFGPMFASFADNWCGIVIDSIAERLSVAGFAMALDPTADDEAWAIWQANNLDFESSLIHTDSLVLGSAYGLVWADENGEPIITAESAMQCYVAYAAGSRRHRTAAIKSWIDDWGYANCNLYLPDAIYKWTSDKPSESSWEKPTWVPRMVAGESWPLVNPLGRVPMVEFRNSPRLLGEGDSQIASIIPLQNATTKLMIDLLVSSEYGSFRQRWSTGISIPEDEDGNPVEPFKAAVDRLWISENSDARFGEFSQTDLSVFVKAIEAVVQHIASQSRVPMHYFLTAGGAQIPSGESLRAAEAGLVSTARAKQRALDDPYEELIRLAFAVRGDQARANATAAQVVWRDPETRTESEHVDAVMKMASLGVPQEVLWAKLGFSPQEIKAMAAMRTTQALLSLTDTTGTTGAP